MKVIKGNQVVILVIALMLVTAGYMNFMDSSKLNETVQSSTEVAEIGDAEFVSSSNVIQDEAVLENSETEGIASNEINDDEKTSRTKETSKSDTSSQYFANSRLDRDNMYSQIVESYQKMIASESMSAEQKGIAQNEITKINNLKNSIMITENLIKTKEFEDVVILVNGESINAIIHSEELKPEEVAQIQNIVSREMKAEIENIHISSK